MKKNSQILVVFPHDTKTLYNEIAKGKAPKERLYGIFELSKLKGIEIVFSNQRHRGIFGKVLTRAKQLGLNPIDLYTIIKIPFTDLVIVKDNFSFSISLFCKIFGKPLIYYDSMFPISKNKLKSFLTGKAANMADLIIGYSKAQSDLYSSHYKIDQKKFLIIEFALDPGFYNSKGHPQREEKILSIGRDTGRDFGTLIESVESTEFSLDLVTLPYLIPENQPKNVLVHQHISYEKLFSLYESCSIVVIPLREGLHHPSGIRALLEAIALKRPVIITATDFVKDNLIEQKSIKFCNPSDSSHLLKKLKEGFPDIKPDDFENILPDYYKNIDKVVKAIQEKLPV